jgi:hypothetical protein
VEIGGTYRYVLTKKAVLAEFEEARKLFLDYRDEAARLSINRILESNASVAVSRRPDSWRSTPWFPVSIL